MTVSAPLDQGRAAFERQAWGNADQQLTAAAREVALEPEDLERLAIKLDTLTTAGAVLAGADVDLTVF